MYGKYTKRLPKSLKLWIRSTCNHKLVNTMYRGQKRESWLRAKELGRGKENHE